MSTVADAEQAQQRVLDHDAVAAVVPDGQKLTLLTAGATGASATAATTTLVQSFAQRADL